MYTLLVAMLIAFTSESEISFTNEEMVVNERVGKDWPETHYKLQIELQNGCCIARKYMAYIPEKLGYDKKQEFIYLGEYWIYMIYKSNTHSGARVSRYRFYKGQ